MRLHYGQRPTPLKEKRINKIANGFGYRTWRRANRIRHDLITEKYSKNKGKPLSPEKERQLADLQELAGILTRRFPRTPLFGIER